MKDVPCGGTRGAKVTGAQLDLRLRLMMKMPLAAELDRSLKGQTVVIMGNSWSLHKTNLKALTRFPIIGCNRALWKPAHGVIPTHLMMGDREPYCQERNAGRLGGFVKGGGKLILSDSVFDPRVLLRGPPENVMRRGQPVPPFKVYVYRIGGGRPAPQGRTINGRKLYLPNIDTFKENLESCQNVCGSLIQAAAIMGAKRIISVGIDLKWPDSGPSHHFGDGTPVGAHSQRTSIPYTQACLAWARDQFKKRKIEFYNFSPVKDCPFAQVWGNSPPIKTLRRIT